MKIFNLAAAVLVAIILTACGAGEGPSTNGQETTTTDTTVTTPEPEPAAPLEELVCRCEMGEGEPEFFILRDCDATARSYVLIPGFAEWNRPEEYTDRLFSAYDEFAELAAEKEITAPVVAYYDEARTKKAWEMEFSNGKPDGTLTAFNEAGQVRIKRVYANGVLESSGPDLGVVMWQFDKATGDLVLQDQEATPELHLLGMRGDQAFDQIEQIRVFSGPLRINGAPYTGKLWLHWDVDGFDLVPKFELNYLDGLKQDTCVNHYGFDALISVKVFDQGEEVTEVDLVTDNEGLWERQQKMKHRRIPRPTNQTLQLEAAGFSSSVVETIRNTGLFLAFNKEGPEYVEGNWNGDEWPDAAFVGTNIPAEADGDYLKHTKSYLMVFYGQEDNRLVPHATSGDLGSEPLRYKSVQALSSSNDSILYSYQSMRHSVHVAVVNTDGKLAIPLKAYSYLGSSHYVNYVEGRSAHGEEQKEITPGAMPLGDLNADSLYEDFLE